MKEGNAFSRIYDIIFREFAHRAKTGLSPIGEPDRESPVIVTGNYTETVRRVRKALNGMNVWLLVANSKGINVWCAAGGGHLTHHDIISAIVTSKVSEKVDTRRIVLPQLSATGIERRKIEEATGWSASWGPAMVDDLPAFLEQKHNATPKQRAVRFPLSDRVEMAILWGVPMMLIGGVVFSILGGLVVGLSVAASAFLIAFGLFTTVPKWNLKGVGKWIPFTIFAAFGTLLSWAILWFFGILDYRTIAFTTFGSVLEMLSLSMDLAGTTPLYGSYINTFRNKAHIELVPERCNGSADCVTVCPREVFKMNGQKHKVDIVSGEACIDCGACIVQCPRDALRFRYENGKVVEAETIRSTRMNMLGRRTISVGEKSGRH